MNITAAMVKELREKTGTGMMQCKKALKETDGDVDKAIAFLRKKGLSDAEKKKDRITNEGLIYSYIHHSGKVGVMLEVTCETDFVARTEKFQTLVKDIAMHIAATDPAYLSTEEVPEEELEKEKNIYAEQMNESGKPEQIIERIVEGKIQKFFTQVCLLEQEFVKDTTQTINALIAKAIAELGENIAVTRFTRYQLGQT